MTKNLLLSLAVLSVTAHGFIFQDAPVAHKTLQDFSKAQQGTLLDIRLDIGQEDPHSQRLALQGLRLELFDNAATNNHPTMPGANGPHPKLSSGPRVLLVKEDAQYVDMRGTQKVGLVDGCWEMIWSDGAPAGNLVCGFHLPKEVKRNDASMPAGRIYLSFPVWTEEGLVKQQAVKQEVQARAAKYEQEKEDAFQKMKETNNVLMKALHFRNAAQALENYDYTGVDSISNAIPDNEDIIPINNGLLLTTKGTVWTKNNSFLGDEHALLGSAMVRPGHDE